MKFLALIAAVQAGQMTMDDDECVTNAQCCQTLGVERYVCATVTENMAGLYTASGNYCVPKAMCGWQLGDPAESSYSVGYFCLNPIPDATACPAVAADPMAMDAQAWIMGEEDERDYIAFDQNRRESRFGIF